MGLGKLWPYALVLCAVLAAGCGAVTAAPPGAGPAGPPAGSRQPAGTPGQRAAADARAILGKFVPPPGAVRLARQPKLPGGSASMSLESATQADATGFWRVSGAAPTLQAWEKSHISRSFSAQDVIIGPPDWNTVYSLPALAGVLPKREMNVQFYDTGGGQTVIMAEAMVSWQPPRPASEVIPDSVTVVTVAGGGGWQGSPAPVTITSVPTVRRLAALINGLPLSTAPAGVLCPDGGPGFRLTFRAAPGGPAIAVTGRAPCGGLSLRLNGKDRPDLQPPRSYAATVLKITSLHWKPL